jgi:hypothetical protein
VYDPPALQLPDGALSLILAVHPDWTGSSSGEPMSTGRKPGLELGATPDGRAVQRAGTKADQMSIWTGPRRLRFAVVGRGLEGLRHPGSAAMIVGWNAIHCG